MVLTMNQRTPVRSCHPAKKLFDDPKSVLREILQSEGASPGAEEQYTFRAIGEQSPPLIEILSSSSSSQSSSSCSSSSESTSSDSSTSSSSSSDCTVADILSTPTATRTASPPPTSTPSGSEEEDIDLEEESLSEEELESDGDENLEVLTDEELDEEDRSFPLVEDSSSTEEMSEAYCRSPSDQWVKVLKLWKASEGVGDLTEGVVSESVGLVGFLLKRKMDCITIDFRDFVEMAFEL
ncbi:uncharacterized protein LOC129003657 [Macrosteles quadrilineatus]|uniref:uncharacterized protein LOC129003657 n=1 Tax=Macrosteles quadrilineatus TaxID=74068 RepID=UPI0023E2ECBC|nr:uncharacterized protein LOC129003657 [Macrosteles quadrilineatus]